MTTVTNSVAYFRLPLRRGRDLRSSEILHSVQWKFLTDVSVQPIGPIPKGLTFLFLNAGQIVCPESSVRNCRSTLSNVTEWGGGGTQSTVLTLGEF